MAKVLLINPNKYGRGITSIWIPSHYAALKAKGHEVKLFDATFYKDWMVNEIAINTANQRYKPSDYEKFIKIKENNVKEDLQKFIDKFNPDIIFWSAISSHLHSEGEYVNIQYGHELMQGIKTKAIKIAGGLQPTAIPEEIAKRFPIIDYFIRGESDLVLTELADNLNNREKFLSTRGICYRNEDKLIINPKQEIISDMDKIPPYDYSIFEDQVFYRPYNGKVIRAVDYELSRGCVHACTYCVETIIQRYYGFTKNINGVLCNSSKYLRCKSAKRVFQELQTLNKNLGIKLIRCQDANFLTIKREVLEELAELIDKSDLDIIIYIETRPEGITPENINLLKKLKVDGAGMGVEVSTESFRKSSLNRFSSQAKIIEAFKLLKEAGIKRTTYNIIGLPEQTENMILETIEFNRLLNPDNISTGFFSPFAGTEQQIKAREMKDFNDYEYDLDQGLRTVSKSILISSALLNFYKNHFVELARDGLDKLDELKKKEGLN